MTAESLEDWFVLVENGANLAHMQERLHENPDLIHTRRERSSPYDLDIQEDARTFLGVSTDGMNALQVALICHGNDDILTFLIRQMPAKFIDMRWGSNNTSLHLASFLGHLKAIQLLASCGADMTLENDLGLTSIDVAVNDETIALFKKLRESDGLSANFRSPKRRKSFSLKNTAASEYIAGSQDSVNKENKVCKQRTMTESPIPAKERRLSNSTRQRRLSDIRSADINSRTSLPKVKDSRVSKLIEDFNDQASKVESASAKALARNGASANSSVHDLRSSIYSSASASQTSLQTPPNAASLASLNKDAAFAANHVSPEETTDGESFEKPVLRRAMHDQQGCASVQQIIAAKNAADSTETLEPAKASAANGPLAAASKLFAMMQTANVSTDSGKRESVDVSVAIPAVPPRRQPTSNTARDMPLAAKPGTPAEPLVSGGALGLRGLTPVIESLPIPGHIPPRATPSPTPSKLSSSMEFTPAGVRPLSGLSSTDGPRKTSLQPIVESPMCKASPISVLRQKRRLFLKVCELRDMNYPADKKTGVLDVYVQIQCGQQSYTTRIAQDHTHPTFNEEFALDLSSDQVIIRLMARKGPEHTARALIEHTKNLFHNSPRRASINGPTQDASLAVITLTELDSDGRDAVVEREYRWQPSLQRRNASGLLRIAFHVNSLVPKTLSECYKLVQDRARARETSVHMAGYLFQRGMDLKFWTRRYFKVWGGKIHCHNDLTLEECLRIDLEQIDRVQALSFEESAIMNSFALLGRNGSAFVEFYADSKQARDDWVKTLNNLTADARKSRSTPANTVPSARNSWPQ